MKWVAALQTDEEFALHLHDYTLPAGMLRGAAYPGCGIPRRHSSGLRKNFPLCGAARVGSIDYMSLYVVLNLEDKYQSTGRGAADSTVKALQKRYEQDKQRHGLVKLFIGKNSLIEHRPVELNGETIGFTTDHTRITQIRSDCDRAEKIYVVAHGDPRTTDVCYTNDPNGVGVVRLADYTGLATFVKSVVPARKTVIRMALVMCYGARCTRYQRAQVDHMGMIPANDIKTSFAYKLFKDLAQVRSLKMTAVTGKIQHDSTSGRALVEHEDMIDENMEFAEAAKAQTVSKGPLNQQYSQLTSSGTSVSTINTEVAKYRANPTLAATTPLEQYAKDLVNWENSGGTAMKARVASAQAAKGAAVANLRGANQDENMHKYGKFIYTYKNNVLKIVSKYGKLNDPVIVPMKVLYQGPLL